MRNESNSSESEKTQTNNQAQKPNSFDFLLNYHVRTSAWIPEPASRRELKGLRFTRDALSALAAAIDKGEANSKMLGVLKVAVYNCAMESISFATSSNNLDIRERHLNMAVRLSSAWVKLNDAQTKPNGKSEQKVTVEHIHVAAGGQAAVGTFEASSQPSAPHKQAPKEIAAPNEQVFSIQSSETSQIKETV